MSRLTKILCAIALVVASGSPGFSDGLSALAKPRLERSSISDEGNGLAVKLALSQPVEWRVFTLADPPRLVLDFREVDWRGTDARQMLNAARATGLRTGVFRPGWSRLVIDLAAPFAVEAAGMQTGVLDGGANLNVQLKPVSGAEFRALSGAPEQADWGTAGAAVKAPEVVGSGVVKVVLDPGHGGIDPGAVADGLREADLVLTFARELQEALIRTGRFSVSLTRNEDIFVPLDQRITKARLADADIFVSLHADALAEGRASGATVYTLSETASDEAAAVLAERHNRVDLLAGVDLTNQDDLVAGVLMDISRLDTAPRSKALASAIVQGIKESGGTLHKRPLQSAGFSVLRAPDIPSVLIELGYLSSETDRRKLVSAEWRQDMAQGIARALETWVDEDTARGALVRH